MSDPLAEDRIAELLLDWEERFERGEDVSAAELCADRPDLIPRLAARIDLLRTVAWVNRPPISDSERGAPLLPPTEPLAGRYRLDALIGQGGYGQVWKGYDLELHRPVAVKLPQPAQVGGNGGEDRILAEARKVARLAHPGIVPVYDVGRHGAGYFIVSELIDGDDLARRLGGNGLPVREAVRVVAEAARHVHYAHTQGFVHRDIKPANLLLDRLGRVLVTDFGIAVPTDGTGAADGAGTLAYMAPEQLFPDPVRVDPRTDVYALGVVLYRAVTGTLPFPATAPATLRHQILHAEPPPPRSVNRAVPPEVERICLRCLAKSPANRHPTAEALADDLARWLDRRRTNRILVGAAWVGLLAVAGFGVAQLVPARDERSAHQRLAANPESARLGEERVLFNGRDLDGWEFISRAYEHEGGMKQVRLEDAASIEAGVLVCREEPRYWFYTRETYADFVLKVEYRFPRKAKWGTGSVVLFRMTQPGPHHGAHPRVRIGGWATARIQKANEGVLTEDSVPKLPGLAEAERPTGEWNELTVSCVGGSVAVRVNGTLVNQDYLDMAAAGMIGLAPQGCAVEFRSVRIRSLHP